LPTFRQLIQLSSSGLKTKCREMRARMLLNECVPGGSVLIRTWETGNVEFFGVR